VRIAVISDVHANLPALEAVLAAVDQQGVDEIWCLGDLVGYGAQPDACVEQVMRRAEACLAGNHDLVVAGEIQMAVFAHDAGAAARWTAKTIAPEHLETLRSLRPSGARGGVELYHASIRDPVWEYVIDDRTAATCLELQQSRLALIGHSHIPLFYGYDATGGFTAGAMPADRELSLAGGPFLLNPGSVGQPRDGDPRAAYLLVDVDGDLAVWRRAKYDIGAAQGAILAAGLPRRLASRLADGR
jgi:predicted phosphodiesterase